MSNSAERTPGRGRVYDDITRAIGDTPLVRAPNIAAKYGARADILLKLEFFNPMASVKDRIAVAMIDTGERDGTITEGTVIVEPTSGNTGIGLAFVCAARGYRCVLTMPESMSIERRRMLAILGAEVVLTPKEDGLNGAIVRADELTAEIEGAVQPGQFVNPANPEIHRRTTAMEIWNDTDGNVDVFISGVGTGGTVTGCGQVLKEKNPDLHVVALEPITSPVLSGGDPGPGNMIQGIGPGFFPETLDRSVIDEVITIVNEDAFRIAKEIAQLDGIPCGISSGAAVHAALQVAAREGMEGKTIVAIIPSFAERYVSTPLFEDL
jgi:cysteine synthase